MRSYHHRRFENIHKRSQTNNKLLELSSGRLRWLEIKVKKNEQINKYKPQVTNR